MSRNIEILAVQYLQKQIKSLSVHLPGILRNEDIECVHKVRVAIRRLDNALRIFKSCFAAKKVKRWRKELRLFRNRLDRARDLDVQIAFLQQFIPTIDDNSYRLGVNRLILRMEQNRKKIQPKLNKSVTEFKKSKFLRDLKRKVNRMKSFHRHHDLRPNDAKMYQKAKKHILKCLVGLLSYEDSLDHPDAIDRHHQMRISAKQLRYQMEAFSPAYDSAFQSILKDMKTIQTYLGNIHDYDVWMDILTKFEGREYQRTLEYFGNADPFQAIRVGIHYFYSHCQQERKRLFAEFTQYWEHIMAENFPDKLRQVLQSETERHSRHACKS